VKTANGTEKFSNRSSKGIHQIASEECYLFSATEMKIERCSRSRLSSRRRWIKGGI